MKEILQNAIDTFGEETQKCQAVSELAELIKAITNDQTGRLDRGNIVEEIADVKIMLMQLEIIYRINEDEMNSEMAWKIDRLEKRLGE